MTVLRAAHISFVLLEAIASFDFLEPATHDAPSMPLETKPQDLEGQSGPS